MIRFFLRFYFILGDWVGDFGWVKRVEIVCFLDDSGFFFNIFGENFLLEMVF